MTKQLMDTISEKRMVEANDENLYFGENKGCKFEASTSKNMQETIF